MMEYHFLLLILETEREHEGYVFYEKRRMTIINLELHQLRLEFLMTLSNYVVKCFRDHMQIRWEGDKL